MAPPRIADQIGRVLGGRYRLVAPLGTGASAHVYVADDVSLRRRVAVKVLHPALAADETFLRRFRSEAHAVAALRHPHLLQVFDWGEDEDGPWLVLEYLSGGSLRDLLDAGHRLTPSQALLVGLQAAQGLDYAHRRGLVHRDIKPANLLFDDEGRLVVADFGLARALAEAAWTEPAGALVGTARYAAPEQAKGSRVDGKADVYALALVLVESVTGRVPFTADTTIATLMARIDRSIEVPAALEPLAAVIHAAGRADPEERADAAHLVLLLEDAAPTLPRPAPIPLSPRDTDRERPLPGSGELTVLPPASAPLASAPSPRLFDAAVADAREPDADPRPAGRRWRRRLLALVVALVVLGAGGAAIAASGLARPSHPVPDLAGKTLAEAEDEVADEEFDVVRTRAQHDEELERGRILRQSPLPGDTLKEGRAVRVVVSDGPAPRTVPELAGLPAEEAERLVSEQRLVPVRQTAFSETVPKGTVIDWSPKGRAPRDSEVTIVVSQGKEPKPVPTLADRAVDAVERLLRGLGFEVGREEAFSDEVEEGEVITTQPPPGTAVQPGDQVKIIVSKGPETVAVPSLRGLSEEQADERLRSAGLRLGDRFGPPKRPVFDSNPPAGAKARRGSAVDIYTR